KGIPGPQYVQYRYREPGYMVDGPILMVYTCTIFAPFYDKRFDSRSEQLLYRGRYIPFDFRCGNLLVLNGHLGGMAHGCRQYLLFGSYGYPYPWQNCPYGKSECPVIMPLIGPEIHIQYYLYPVFIGDFRSVKG